MRASSVTHETCAIRLLLSLDHASGSPRPVIRMPCPDRLHPVKLFRQHPAHQKMRPGERAEREPIFRARLYGLIKPFRAADHEARGATSLIPACQQRGQAFCIGHGAAKIQGDRHRAGRDGGEDRGTFSAADFGFVAARFGDFDKLWRRAQPRRVMGVKRCLRPRLDPPDSDDPNRAQRRPAPSARGFPGPTCVPADKVLVHRGGTNGSPDRRHQSAPNPVRPGWHRA